MIVNRGVHPSKLEEGTTFDRSNGASVSLLCIFEILQNANRFLSILILFENKRVYCLNETTCYTLFY